MFFIKYFFYMYFLLVFRSLISTSFTKDGFFDNIRFWHNLILIRKPKLLRFVFWYFLGINIQNVLSLFKYFLLNSYVFIIRLGSSTTPGISYIYRNKHLKHLTGWLKKSSVKTSFIFTNVPIAFIKMVFRSQLFWRGVCMCV